MLWLVFGFAGLTHIPLQAWRHTKRGRPKMSAKLLRVLSQLRPDLKAVAAQGAGEEPQRVSVCFRVLVFFQYVKPRCRFAHQTCSHCEPQW